MTNDNDDDDQPCLVSRLVFLVGDGVCGTCARQRVAFSSSIVLSCLVLSCLVLWSRVVEGAVVVSLSLSLAWWICNAALRPTICTHSQFIQVAVGSTDLPIGGSTAMIIVAHASTTQCALSLMSVACQTPMVIDDDPHDKKCERSQIEPNSMLLVFLPSQRTPHITTHTQKAIMIRSSLRLTALLSLCLVTPARAFAAWLKCYVELDVEEVIMNQYIVPFQDVEETMLWQIRFDADDAWRTVTADTAVPIDSYPTALQIRLQLADASVDLQYVADILGSPTAQFAHGMCDDKRRAVGRNRAGVDVLLRSPTRILAGWAVGHEAVKLTSVLSLGDDDDNTDDDDGDDDGDEEEQEKEEQDL
eukprot:CAMPEP_0198114388 /NCGR_PEP_ID=MMETSP1442-20131203/5791_1 /TAXON_ID= /ORGANISM="Craspedostauros australis, Strain CCMP3328" /LENGTH=359 /DNA_ID=CAMNT_0043771693 /DNA_START=155 /DNA_END=1234 /DNA_ORIENTATION=+